MPNQRTPAKKPKPQAKKPQRATARAAGSCPEPPPGTVRSKVIYIIEGLTAARPVRDTSTLDDLGLNQQRLTMCLNTRLSVGIPDGTFDGETRVSQVIGTVQHQLGA